VKICRVVERVFLRHWLCQMPSQTFPVLSFPIEHLFTKKNIMYVYVVADIYTYIVRSVLLFHNNAASVFGEQSKLEPMSSDRKARWRKEIEWFLSVTDHIVEFVPSQQKSKDGTNMEVRNLSRTNMDPECNFDHVVFLLDVFVFVINLIDNGDSAKK
jgi:hypothetical protein